MSRQRALTVEQQELNDPWEAHLRAEFEAHSADETVKTMVANPLVNHLLKRDKDRTSALVAGLAATIAAWTFAAAFAPEELESLSRYSPWFYGPAATAAWALFSEIAYLFMSRGLDRRTLLDSRKSYRCPELAIALKSNGHSVCTNQNEKNRLCAVTAGFALTITAWVGALSFMPENWIDCLGKSPAWICCVASMILWSTLSAAVYPVFRASSEKSGEPPGR
jgi:hypothetical protein